jgi:hypothetical protein
MRNGVMRQVTLHHSVGSNGSRLEGTQQGGVFRFFCVSVFSNNHTPFLLVWGEHFLYKGLKTCLKDGEKVPHRFRRDSHREFPVSAIFSN